MVNAKRIDAVVCREIDDAFQMQPPITPGPGQTSLAARLRAAVRAAVHRRLVNKDCV